MDNIHRTSETILDKLASLSTSSESNKNNPNISVLPIPSTLIDTTFSSTTNLTTTVLGAKILSFSDEYFADAANLLTPTPAIRKEGYYVHTGAWYDGWETRRHNTKPFDWVVIKLGCVGEIEAVEVDTAHFSGNEAPAAGLDGCFLPDSTSSSSSNTDNNNNNNNETETKTESGVETEQFTQWTEILPPQKCGPKQRQAWRVSGPDVSGKQYTHLRLKMYPDGGIARLRVYGRVVPPPLPPSTSTSTTTNARPLEDLASALNGGVATSCSDQHFGTKSNLILPGRGKDMGDGWETARSRTPNHTDWTIIRLGLKGTCVEKIVVDTKDFRGNFPQSVKVLGWSVERAKAALGTEREPDGKSKDEESKWVDLLKVDGKCKADTEHVFEGSDLSDAVKGEEGKVWTHVKMVIIPDGGVKRLRVWGRRA